MEIKKNRAEKGVPLDVRIPFLGGRPDRESAIGHEDIVDLEIILNTNETIETIIERI